MDPAWYASLFPTISGKQCVVYKCIVEESVEKFNEWLEASYIKYGHTAYNLVGAPTSSKEYTGATLAQAANSIQTVNKCASNLNLTSKRGTAAFGCVCIPERHTTKGNENINMRRKVDLGCEWFITQGIYSEGAVIKLLNTYGDDCKSADIVPKKVVLTFAPCGRPKTMQFIKWLGMHVPPAVEERIFGARDPVQESVELCCELLVSILQHTSTSGVPLGINVESLSIFKEEINAAHTLFQRLQVQYSVV